MKRGEGQRRPHALVLPCAAQGHINPLMQLAQHLTACHGFQITFINTHDHHARILQHSLGLQPQPQPQPLANAYTSCRCPSYPDIELVGLSPAAPPPPSQLSPPFHSDFLLLPFIPLIERLICDINLSPNPLTCIIADAFLYWLPPIARTAHIPSLIAFFPSSAANLLLLCHTPSLLSSGVVNSDGTLGGCEKLLIGLKGLPSIQSKDASWIAGLPSNAIHVMFNTAISVDII